MRHGETIAEGVGVDWGLAGDGMWGQGGGEGGREEEMDLLPSPLAIRRDGVDDAIGADRKGRRRGGGNRENGLLGDGASITAGCSTGSTAAHAVAFAAGSSSSPSKRIVVGTRGH